MADVINYNTAAVVAGTPVTVDVFTVPGHGGTAYALGEATFVSPTAQAAQGATNFVTLSLQYSRAGGAPVVVGSLNLGTVALVANVAVQFALTAQEVSQLRQGDVLQFAAVHTGTGGAVAAGLLEVEAE